MTTPTDPIPGTSPTQPIQGPTEKPPLGAEEVRGQEQRPFTLPRTPNPEAGQAAEAATTKPTPMQVMSDVEQQRQPPMNPEQLQDHLTRLKEGFAQAQSKLSNPANLAKLTDDHYKALTRWTEVLNPNLKTIAKNTDTEFSPIKKKKGETALSYVTRWIDGSQDTLTSALNFFSTQSNPNPASMLKIQYAVQRAVQRVELFSSIIGSSVSGVKTLMSTQLG